MIVILDDHPGTRPGAVQVDGNKISVRIRREPMTRADWTTHDYNVHFCVGLENRGNSDVILELSVEDGRWGELPNHTPLLYTAAVPSGPFRRASLAARTDLARRYSARVPLAAGSKLYVANTLVRCLEYLNREFDDLGRRGSADRRVIGRSLQGRDIVAYCYGRSSGGVLVTSGFHPPEPDTFATAEIMRHLTEPAGQALVAKTPVVVVPVANPDGYALGTQGANAEGINFYWNFACAQPDRCSEAAALWDLAAAMRPRGYIDFHCYTFQLKKRPGPYLRPFLFYSAPDVRRAAQELYAKLAQDKQSSGVTGFGAYAPQTFGAMLAENFDTLALAKYHLHLAEGEEGCRARGLRVFHAMVESILDHGLIGPASKQGAGWRSPIRTARICWAGLVRPMLGRLRRGQFDRIQFERTTLVSPEAGARGKMT